MKPFGQPVTEIFDFEEGSRFAALTVCTPERNDSLAESHGLYQNEYVEPRDHPVRSPCLLLSHLQLLIQLIEEHPHIALLIVGQD